MDIRTNSDIRNNNRRRIVSTLFREGAMTKQALAAKLNLSMPTITLLLKDLKNIGVIKNGEQLESTGGRKPTTIMPVYDFKYSVGIEVTLYEIRIVVIDMGLNIIAKESYDIPLERSVEYWKKLHEIADNMIKRYVCETEKLLELNIAMPFYLREGIMVRKKLYSNTQRFEPREMLKDYPVNIRFVNSAKAATLGFIWRNDMHENFVYFSLGRYVTSAIAYQSKVISFSEGSGFLGMICNRTEKGYERLEDYAMLHNLCSKAGVENLPELKEKLENRDETALKVWDEFICRLAEAVFNVHKIFGWKVYAGGETSPYLVPYKDVIIEKLQAMETYETEEEPYFDFIKNEIFGAATGVAQIAIDEYMNTMFDDI